MAIRSSLRAAASIALVALISNRSDAQREIVDPALEARRAAAEARIPEMYAAGARIKGMMDRLGELPLSEQTKFKSKFDAAAKLAAEIDGRSTGLNAESRAVNESIAAFNANPSRTEAQFRALQRRAESNARDQLANYTAATDQLVPRLNAISSEIETALSIAGNVDNLVQKGKFGYDDDAAKATALAGTAQQLASDSKYQPNGNETKCNFFVQDLTTKFLGISLPELADVKANVMYENMSASQNFTPLNFQDNEAAAFDKAQELADHGELVLVAYKNPNPQNSGHVAVVVPFEGKKSVRYSESWKATVPTIAQAGPSVFASGRLSAGFRPSQRITMEISVLKRRVPR